MAGVRMSVVALSGWTVLTDNPVLNHMWHSRPGEVVGLGTGVPGLGHLLDARSSPRGEPCEPALRDAGAETQRGARGPMYEHHM